MTMAVLEKGFRKESFEAFLGSRAEPDWLSDVRRAAWKTFEELPLPRRTQEEWMRTDIRLLRLDQFGFPGEATSTSLPSTLLSEGVTLGGHTASLDGNLVSASLSETLAKQGVLFGSISELAAKHESILRPLLTNRAVPTETDKFAALQAAAWSAGTLLYVPRGVTVEAPLHILSAMTAGGVDLGYTLVVLEDGAEATLLSETAGEEGAALHCGSIELYVANEARLRYVNLQNWGRGTWHFAHQRGQVGRDASLQWTIGALGSRLAQVNQHVKLVGEGANVQVNGAMFTEGKQHLTYNTLQHHRAPSCKSDLLYKGGLQDASRLVWRGMIKVDKDAQKTDAYQRDDNLMLSDAARADSIPGLEIEADDVRCTHGATAGRVDDEQLFYAQARGLSRKEAARLIVSGFFQQVFDRITIENVREALATAIDRRVREIG
jgi:Fe-S cluster assembly protein SufD